MTSTNPFHLNVHSNSFVLPPLQNQGFKDYQVTVCLFLIKCTYLGYFLDFSSSMDI